LFCFVFTETCAFRDHSVIARQIASNTRYILTVMLKSMQITSFPILSAF
jgi:hypothetical protein